MTEALDAALLVVRVTVGIVFIAHGVKHALGRVKTTAWFKSLGWNAPGFQWFMSTGTEIGVGILLIFGFLTSFAAAGLIGIMFVAYWTVHRFAGFFITAFMQEGIEVEGWEYVWVLAMIGAALAISGPGSISVDDAIGLADQLDAWVGLAIALAGVVLGLGLVATFWRPKTADT
ncbi:MAG: DoxX family protein [Acidimicrobiia bacterium]